MSSAVFPPVEDMTTYDNLSLIDFTANDEPALALPDADEHLEDFNFDDYLAFPPQGGTDELQRCSPPQTVYLASVKPPYSLCKSLLTFRSSRFIQPSTLIIKILFILRATAVEMSILCLVSMHQLSILPLPKVQSRHLLKSVLMTVW